MIKITHHKGTDSGAFIFEVDNVKHRINWYMFEMFYGGIITNYNGTHFGTEVQLKDFIRHTSSKKIINMLPSDVIMRICEIDKTFFTLLSPVLIAQIRMELNK